MTCLNCSADFESKFCPACGQSAHIHPITVKQVLHDLVHAFTHADKGFLLTLKELTVRPGKVALAYIAGQRKRYFNPLSFLVITMALSAYLAYKSGYFASMNQRAVNAPSIDLSTVDGITYDMAIKESGRIIINEGKMIGLILITPLLAFLSWLFFRRPRHNFAEHFVLQSYLFGLSNVARVVIFIPIHLLLPGKIQLIDMLFQIMFLVYMIVGARQFFQRNIFLTIIKCLLMFVGFIFFFWWIIRGYAYAKLWVLYLMQ